MNYKWGTNVWFICLIFCLFVQEEFVMGWDDLLSSVGGALGLWLGFSVISIGVFCIQVVGKIGLSNICKWLFLQIEVQYNKFIYMGKIVFFYAVLLMEASWLSSLGYNLISIIYKSILCLWSLHKTFNLQKDRQLSLFFCMKTFWLHSFYKRKYCLVTYNQNR